MSELIPIEWLFGFCCITYLMGYFMGWCHVKECDNCRRTREENELLREAEEIKTKRSCKRL